MSINQDTKISKILEENEKAIDTIASVNSNFKKLQNPFLRKLFAPRVSIKDAAKIGGTTSNEILRKLEAIGFEVEYSEHNNGNIINNNKIIMKKDKLVTLDVRPILETGTDPYHAIMDTLKAMSKDKTLLIINTFEPVPLLNKLKSKGYTYEIERPEDNVVHTYLTNDGEIENNTKKDKENIEELTFEQAEIKYKGKMHEVDVRDLEMPLPMVTILQEIEKIPEGEVLFVHHKRLPQYLLPELKTRGWAYVNKEIDDNNMNFIIYKK
ncbi:MAG: DUF2249 domain-containing protein [Bacteroidales bacterium]|nr:DUF2249 domain-containing protein [Bacteroidales bacterium]